MKSWVKIGVALVTVAVGVIYAVGLSLPRNHTISLSRTFEVPAPALFGAAVNIDDWPHWRSDVDGVIHLEGQGFRAEIAFGSDRLTYEFEGDFEGLSMVSTILDQDIPFGGSWRFEVQSNSPTSSTLTITEDGFVDPPLWRFLSRFVMGHEATARRFLDDLSVVCLEGACATKGS